MIVGQLFDEKCNIVSRSYKYESYDCDFWWL